jgi:hypothetical protein
MIIRSIQQTLAAMAVTGMLAACGASKTPDSSSVAVPLALPSDATDTAAGPASVASDGPQQTQPTAPTTAIPAATDDIWRALDKQGAGLDAAIKKGALKDVPGKADAIRDLTAALPAHASKLSADAQTKLQQDVAFIAAYAGKLDAAANAGDQAAAKANYKKLNDVLGGITRFP